MRSRTMSSVKDLYLSDELETAAKLIQLGFGEFQNLDWGNDFYFATHHIPVLQEDLDLLANDKDLERLIHLLSEFGKCARYHNLDIVTSAEKPSINVKMLWENYENNIVKSNQKFLQKLSDPNTAEEVLDYTKRQILIKYKLEGVHEAGMAILGKSITPFIEMALKLG